MGIIDGFGTLFASYHALFFVFLGTVVGILVGAVPGLTGTATIALLLPLTYFMDPLPALILVYTIAKASDFGGSIPGILFNTPGTPQAAATQMEGFPLTRQGKQGKALRMAVLASATGDFFSETLLIAGTGVIAVYALKMGPPEYLAVYFCAFIIISSVIGESIIKGLVSTFMGLTFALVGLDSITATSRFTFGSDYLEEGIPLIPLLLGIFVLSEVFIQVRKRAELKAGRTIAKESDNPADHKVSWKEYRTCFPTMLRSAVIGSSIGMLPGVGATVATFVAYGEARRRSKGEGNWGKGEIKGIAAAEAANNATSGANIIPLLTLGIPGSTTAALLLGVMQIHGIMVGPQVFTTSHNLIYGLFAGGLMSILTYLVVGYVGGGFIGRVIGRIPSSVVYPLIFMICFISTYASRQAFFDLGVLVFFGLFGYLIRRFNLSIPAFVIAFLLGGGVERSLRQTLLLDDRGLWMILHRPIALILILLGVMVIVARGYSLYRKKRALA